MVENTKMTEATNQVSATHTKTDRTVTVTYDFGQNLADMVKHFGEEVVYANARQQMIISLQARMRRQLHVEEGEKELTDAEFQKSASEWKPGVVSQVRRSPSQKAKEAFGKLSEAEKKELLKELRS